MTYPDNPPYAGGPDEVVPQGALSDTGLAALAGKTQADFEEELFGAVTGKIDPLTELFSVVTETFLAVVDKIVEVFSGFVDLDAAINTLDDILQFFYNVADRAGVLAALEDLFDIVESIGGTFFTVLEDIVGWFGSVIDLPNIDSLDGFFAVLGQIIDFFAGIAGDALGGFLDTLKTVVNWLLTIAGLENVDSLGDFLDIVEDVVGFFGSILDLPAWTGALKTLIDALLSIVDLPTWVSYLTTLVNGILDIPVLSTFVANLKTLINGLSGVANLSTWVSYLTTLVNSLLDVEFLANFMTVLKTLVNGIGTQVADIGAWVNTVVTFISGLIGTANLSTWVSTLKTFITGLVGTVNLGTFVSVLKQVIEFFMTFAGNVLGPFLEALRTVVNTFSGLFVNGTLTDWLGSIPQFGQELVNTLWSAVNGGAEAIGKTIEDALAGVAGFATGLIRQITGDPNALALGDLATWAGDLLTKALTWEDLLGIFGTIPASLLGVLPIPSINLVNPELMGQGGFDTSTELEAGSGWSWDSTQRYPTTATTGGSAKATGGATRNLYAKQSIPVAEGDKLVVTCYVKSSGSVSSNSIKLDVVEIRGDNTTVTRSIAARGASSSWVLLGNTVAEPYVVGSGVVSIRVKLGTTTGVSAGSSVWFDNISVKKVGLLDGNWMSGILGTAAQDLQGIVDGVINGVKEAVTSGNPLTAVQTTVETIFSTLFGLAFLPLNIVANPLLETAIPGLNGSKITGGEVSLDFLPVQGIGGEINPSAGSGATLVRSGQSTYNSKTGRNPIGPGFYTALASSSDITALTSNGAYTGQFQVSMDGWYLCEISYLLDPTSGFGWKVAPLLYKNGSPFRIGSDAMAVQAILSNYQRYAQSSFIVYLQAGENVGAGYDASGAFNNLFGGSGSSVDTYFSVSLLNKSYA